MKIKALFHLFNQLLLVGILLSLLDATAQVRPQKQALLQVLETLQARFDCTFSYADKSITNQHISPLESHLTLEQSITILREKTSLEFTQIDAETIAISPKPYKHTFCGILTDSETKAPIPNTTIWYKNTEITSDLKGYFSFSTTVFPITLRLSCLGYEPKQISVSAANTSCQQLVMTPKIEQLHPIFVRNYITKGISQQSNGTFEIDYGDFGILPGLIEPDVLQTLQALPGIQSVNESVSDINIRGGTNDQNLVLWDGIKMYQSGHFFGLISAFNPYLTQKATVTKNGTNARYGDGVSGVITIKTSDSIPTKTKAGLGVNLINIDGYVDTPVGKKSGLQLAIRKSYSELLETPTFDRFFSKAFQNSEVVSTANTSLNSEEQFSFFDISARGLYQLSKNDHLKANFLWIENDLTFQENGILNSNATSRESKAAQRNRSGSLNYNRKWSAGSHSQVQFSASAYQLEAINADIENEQRLLQNNEVAETNFLIKHALHPTKSLSLSGGYQFTETGITNIQDVNNPVVRRAIKNVLRNHGVFFTSEYETKGKKNSSAVHFGIRANYFAKFNRVLIEPRLRIAQQFWDKFTVHLAAELKSQTTSQRIDFQNDFLGIENRRWQLSNAEDIPILRSKQVSIGLQYRHKGWLWSAEGYLKKVSGITTQSQGFQNQFQFVLDTGSYAVNGIDLLVHRSLLNASAWLSYSYANNSYTFDQLLPTSFPNVIDIRHTLTAGTAYTLDNFKFSAGFNWHSGKPNTLLINDNEILDGQLNYDRPNAANIKDFLRIDASAIYTFKIDDDTRIQAGISIWNITNATNNYNSFYTIMEDKALQVNQNGLKFTPNAILRVFF